eukprot:202140_1
MNTTEAGSIEVSEVMEIEWTEWYIMIDCIGMTVAFLVIACLICGIAEYFRRRIFIAFYVYLLLFIGTSPFLFYPDPDIIPRMAQIKYFFISIPYLLMLMAIMAITPGNSIIQRLSSKIFKLNVTNTDELSSARQGYRTWISWLCWTVFVFPVFYGSFVDSNDGSITNAVCGIILCLPFNFPIPIQSLTATQRPKGEYFVYVNKDNRTYEWRVYGISLLYIIAFSSWFTCFQMGLNGEIWRIWFAFTALGVPLIRAVHNNRSDLWMFYIVFAMGFAAMASVSLRQIKTMRAGVVTYEDYKIQRARDAFLFWGGLNCIGATLNFSIHLWKFCKEKPHDDECGGINMDMDTNTAPTQTDNDEEQWDL